ncbi:MAG: hypothetical protein ACRDDZ_09435 [Marinifilaceae bacterium]
MIQEIEQLAASNTQKAIEIIETTGIVESWETIGAEIHVVGSLAMGLMVKHRDIDLHIYTSALSIEESFKAMARVAATPGITKITYVNLAETEEACIEWHAWYLDDEGNEWQIDMIHIKQNSKYDGYFERLADKVYDALTPETREIIMTLKYQTPDEVSVAGIEYYHAVLGHGINNYADFMTWRQANPVTGIVEWMP